MKPTLRVGKRDPEMMFIYISGPMRGSTPIEVKYNENLAWTYAVYLWEAGHAPLCPHMNGARMEGAVTVKQFMRGDLLMLERCDAIIMLPRWKESKGAVLEHSHAEKLGLKIYYSMKEVPKVLAPTPAS